LKKKKNSSFIGGYLTSRILLGSAITAVDILPILAVRIDTLNSVH
jgi:hypothetical protein